MKLADYGSWGLLLPYGTGAHQATLRSGSPIIGLIRAVWGSDNPSFR